MSKAVAALSLLVILLLTGCFAPDSGSDDSAGSGSDGMSGSTEQGGDGSAENEAAESEPDENEADDNEAEGNGDDSEDEPAPVSGPCDAVVPFDEVSGLIHDPSAGAMTTGGDVISQCEWLSADGDQSLSVSARDAALIGVQGVDKAYRKRAIKNLGEEAGSRLKTGMASVQVYALVKGTGKAQPVLYTVTWNGEDVEVAALIHIAKRIV